MPLFTSLASSLHSEINLFSILAAQISTPFTGYRLDRNPRYRNAGNFMRLSDFLNFTIDKDLSGIMISIEVSIYVNTESPSA